MGSPASLDHDDHDPPTPTWDCVFPDPEVVGAGSEGGDGVSTAEEMSGRDEVIRTEDEPFIGKDKGKGKEMAVPVEQTLDADVVMQDVDDSGVLNSLFTCYTVPSKQTLPAIPESIASHSPEPSSSFTSYLPVASTSSAPPPTSTQPALPFPLSIAIPILQVTTQSSTPSTSSSTSPASQPSQYKLHKQETLKRARAMRAQIVAEIQRAKVELWETAMEGGCLVVLGKEVAKAQKGKERA